MRRGLILVSYYLRTMDEVRDLINAFTADTQLAYEKVLIVDNAGVLPRTLETGGAIEVIYGSNKSWEFSGWRDGLAHALTWPSMKTLTLLNDSYQRNWNVTVASRSMICTMYRYADAGHVCGLLDNFSFLRRPRFSRRPNSRLVVLSGDCLEVMATSLVNAMDTCSSIAVGRGALFDPDETQVLYSWLASQSGRWPQDTMHTRLRRIFIEHHLFDWVPSERLVLFPRRRFGSLLYAATRLLFRERR